MISSNKNPLAETKNKNVFVQQIVEGEFDILCRTRPNGLFMDENDKNQVKNSSPIPKKDGHFNDNEISDEDSDEYVMKDDESLKDYVERIFNDAFQ